MYHRMLSVCFRMFSVWFQNAFRIDRILPACWLRKVSFSERFPNAFRTRRIDLEWTEPFPHAFRTLFEGYWKRSESIRHVLGPFGVFGKHTDPAPPTRCMLPERFPYMPHAPRKLPEYFPNTHTPHSDDRWTLFWTCTTHFWSYRMPFRMHPYGAEQPVCS